MPSLWILIPIIAVVSLAAIGFTISRLYKRTTKELSFVRTGLGAETVVMDGGAVVMGSFHEIQWVNMKTLKLVVERNKQDALITKDKMRVDVVAEFYVRVKQDQVAVSTAARTLGERTRDPQALREFIEAKLVDVLRSVAAGMELNELHEKRADFVQKVSAEIVNDLEKTGLELETISLTGLDQTDIQYFTETNIFDAEGLAKIKTQTEARKKEINEVEQSTSVAIEKRNMEAAKEKLDIEEEETTATLEQQRQLSERQAEQAATIAQTNAEQKRISDLVIIEAEEQTEQARIAKTKSIQEATIQTGLVIEQAEIAKGQQLAVAEQDKQIKIAQKSEEKSAADARANLARAEAVEAEQKVITAEATAEAERSKSIQVISAETEAEVQATSIRVAASASKDAAVDEAEAVMITAKASKDSTILAAVAESESEVLKSVGVLALMQAEATGLIKVNEAKNALSPDQVNLEQRKILIDQLPSIIAESVKPLENIDSIKLIDANGLTGRTESSGGLVDQVVAGALKHQAQAPLIKTLLDELGIDVTNLSGLVNTVKEVVSSEDITG